MPPESEIKSSDHKEEPEKTPGSPSVEKVKPSLHDSPLNEQLILAQTPNQDEKVDSAQVELLETIANETPPWEDQPDLPKSSESEERTVRLPVDQEEDAAGEAAVERQRTEQLPEPNSGSKPNPVPKSFPPRRGETTANPCPDTWLETGPPRPTAQVRRPSSEGLGLRRDDAVTFASYRKSRGGPPALRCWPSFPADASPQSFIGSVTCMTCSHCRTNDGTVTITEDLAGITRPLECPAEQMTTPISHVGKRPLSPLVIPDVWYGEKPGLHDCPEGTRISCRKCSSAHFDVENVEVGKEQAPNGIQAVTSDIVNSGEKRDQKTSHSSQPGEGNRSRRVRDLKNESAPSLKKVTNRTPIKVDPGKVTLTRTSASTDSTPANKATTDAVKDRGQLKKNLNKTDASKIAVPQPDQSRVEGVKRAPPRNSLVGTGATCPGRSGPTPARLPETKATTSRVTAAIPAHPSKRSSASPGDNAGGTVAARRTVPGSGLGTVAGQGQPTSGSGSGVRQSKSTIGSTRLAQTAKRTVKSAMV